MQQLLSDLVEKSSISTLQLLRSQLRTTEVVLDYLNKAAARASAEVVAFNLDTDSDEGVVNAVSAAMAEGRWVYIANVSPSHDTMLRKVALLAFTTDSRFIDPKFRLWMTTLTQHCSFEPPPIHTGQALPKVLLHLCNAPESLLGDMDTMKIAPRHQADRSMYDDQDYSVMAETAEKLLENDPAVVSLSYEASRNRADGAEFFLLLPGAFRHNTHLATLDLTHCGIGERGCVQLGSALKVNRGLTKIDLTRNQIGDESIDALCEGLRENRALRWLSLAANTGIGDAGITALGDALTKGCGIETLVLHQNNSLQKEHAWRRSAIGALWDGVVSSKIHTLDVSGCELSGYSASMLAERLAGNTRLTDLTLANNRLGDAGAVPFARLLKEKRNSTIAKLNLDDCCVGCVTFQAMGAALRVNTSLVDLSLGRSAPGYMKCFEYIKLDEEEDEEPTLPVALDVDETPTAGVLEDHILVEKMKMVRLSSPDLAEAIAKAEEAVKHIPECPDGMLMLAGGLAENTTLQALNLGSSRLNDSLIRRLCHVLCGDNSTLTDIDLSGNPAIGDTGSMSLQTTLKGGFNGDKACPLTKLTCSDNADCFGERVILSLNVARLEEVTMINVGVTDGVALSLRDILSKADPGWLRKLDLSWNALYKEGFKRMGEILEENRVIEELALRGNLNNAHLETLLPLHEKGTALEGLPRFKDDGLEQVAAFHTSLSRLSPKTSALRYLDLQENTLTDTCLQHLLGSVERLELAFTINLTGNYHTASIIPVIDGFATGTPNVSIIIDEPHQDEAEAA